MPHLIHHGICCELCVLISLLWFLTRWCTHRHFRVESKLACLFIQTCCHDFQERLIPISIEQQVTANRSIRSVFQGQHGWIQRRLGCFEGCSEHIYLGPSFQVSVLSTGSPQVASRVFPPKDLGHAFPNALWLKGVCMCVYIYIYIYVYVYIYIYIYIYICIMFTRVFNVKGLRHSRCLSIRRLMDTLLSCRDFG